MSQKRSNKKRVSMIDKLEKWSTIFLAILSALTLVYTIGSNSSQDQKWEKNYDAQNQEILSIREQSNILESSLIELNKQNVILQLTLDELNKQTEQNERSLELLLAEKGVQCRISYMGCYIYSLMPLLDDLKQNHLLIVDNELSNILSLDKLLIANDDERYALLQQAEETFGPHSNSFVVLLLIDLTSNNIVLTDKLTLDVSEISFNNHLPFAASRLFMYSLPFVIDRNGVIVSTEPLVENKKEMTYKFADQFVGEGAKTTILCPVLFQTISNTDYSSKLKLEQCDVTYKYVSIPHSISFNDPLSAEMIHISIRDMNTQAAITEYTELYGLG